MSDFPEHGYFNVKDASGTIQAGMLVNDAGQGRIFADVKNFRMEHPEDKTKEIWYASLEGPEAGAYERGRGKLENGEAYIHFSDHYQIVANMNTATLVLTPMSANTYGLAIVEINDDGFRVKELMNGTGNFQFMWEVKAVRKGYEDYKVIRNADEFPPREGVGTAATERLTDEEKVDPKLQQPLPETTTPGKRRPRPKQVDPKLEKLLNGE